MIYDWSPQVSSRLNKTFILPIALVILFFSGIYGPIYEKPLAQAQVQVYPEEPEYWQATLKLAGASCDVNAAESAVLHLKGVISVDIEAKKDHLLVGYDPQKVSPEQMVDAIGKKKGCNANIVGAGREE